VLTGDDRRAFERRKSAKPLQTKGDFFTDYVYSVRLQKQQTDWLLLLPLTQQGTVEQETNTPTDLSAEVLPPEEQGSLDTVNPIRTETVFSRLPLHILSKSGKRPEIRIEKVGANGKIELRWLVSYSDSYGPARQLAYDLDTLIIERALEEAFEEARQAGQDLPRIVPIGSLTEICQKLGMTDGGRNLDKIKRALQQNALAGITAYVKYRANDGSEQWVDATFTRYGVIFTGKKLPDGKKAEQTYISTSNEYHHVLSTAPTRPLDYNYKAQLAPTPRRLYELISFAIYGALRNRLAVATYRYSEYCDRAPQLRYFTFDQVKKQMYKVHLPHIKFGYITKVKYAETTDEQGRADWLMYYTPGPKARAEFETFTGKRPRIVPAANLVSLPARERTSHKPRQKTFHFAQTEGEPSSTQVKVNLYTEAVRPVHPQYREALEILQSRGVDQAEEILTKLPHDQPILDQLEYLTSLIDNDPQSFKKPAAFIRSRLESNINVPPDFKTQAQRQAEEQAHAEVSAREEQHRFDQMAIQHAYEEYINQVADRYLEDPVHHGELRSLFDRQTLFAKKQWPTMAEGQLARIIRGLVRGEVKKTIPLLTLEEFRQTRPDLQQVTEQSTETATQTPSVAPESAPEQTQNPSDDSPVPPAKNTLLQAEILLPEPTPGTDPVLSLEPSPQTPAPAAADPDTLSRYQQYRRSQAEQAYASLNPADRGRLATTARQHLLTEHPEKDRFQGSPHETEYKAR
jgi:hypothetical protein